MEGPIATYAYTGELLLPVRVTPGIGAMTLHAEASWLVCKEICVPEQGKFTLELPAGTPAPLRPGGVVHARRQPHPARHRLAGHDRTGRVTLRVEGTEISPRLDRRGVVHAGGTGWHRPWRRPEAVDRSGPADPGPDNPGRQFKPEAALDGVLSIRDRSASAATSRCMPTPAHPRSPSRPRSRRWRWEKCWAWRSWAA